MGSINATAKLEVCLAVEAVIRVGLVINQIQTHDHHSCLKERAGAAAALAVVVGGALLANSASGVFMTTFEGGMCHL